jgi:hypothetical protein
MPRPTMTIQLADLRFTGDDLDAMHFVQNALEDRDHHVELRGAFPDYRLDVFAIYNDAKQLAADYEEILRDVCAEYKVALP